MPIYEYHCPHCRKNFEEWLKSDDDASMHPCPTCGASSPRIISQTTFILKGGGWYVTEYGSHHTESEGASPETSQDAPKNSSASDADKGAAKDASSDTKSDDAKTKSAASAPAKNAAKPAPRPAVSQTAPSMSESKPAAASV